MRLCRHLWAVSLHDLAVLKDAAAIFVHNGISQAIEVVQRLEVGAAGELECFVDAASRWVPSQIHLRPTAHA